MKTVHLFRVRTIEQRVDAKIERGGDGFQRTLTQSELPVRVVTLVPDRGEYGREVGGGFNEEAPKGVFLEHGSITLRLEDPAEWEKYALDRAVQVLLSVNEKL